MNAPKRILVPIDFSEISDAAVRYAVILAGALDAGLDLLHVAENPLAAITPANGYAMPPDFLQEMEEGARERLEHVLTVDAQSRFRARLEVREGSPFVEIVRFAREQQIDLIVMGTHGRGPIAHMLLGSVAEQVLRKAACPVLVVRKPRQPFSLP